MADNLYATLQYQLDKQIQEAIETSPMNLYQLGAKSIYFDPSIKSIEIPVRSEFTQYPAVYIPNQDAPFAEVIYKKRRVSWDSLVLNHFLSEELLNFSVQGTRMSIMEAMVDGFKRFYDKAFIDSLTSDVQEVDTNGAVNTISFNDSVYPAGNYIQLGSTLDMSAISLLQYIADKNGWSPMDKKILLLDVQSFNSLRNSNGVTIDHIGVQQLSDFSDEINFYNAVGFKFRDIYFIQVWDKLLETISGTPDKKILLFFNARSICSDIQPVRARYESSAKNYNDGVLLFKGNFIGVRTFEKGVFKVEAELPTPTP